MLLGKEKQWIVLYSTNISPKILVVVLVKQKVAQSANTNV